MSTRREIEQQVASILTSGYADVVPGDWDTDALMDALYDAAGSWGAVLDMDSAVFWSIVREHDQSQQGGAA